MEYRTNLSTYLQREKLRRASIGVSPTVVRCLFSQGAITEEDYKKYFLCEDPEFIPPIKKEFLANSNTGVDFTLIR